MVKYDFVIKLNLYFGGLNHPCLYFRFVMAVLTLVVNVNNNINNNNNNLNQVSIWALFKSETFLKLWSYM